MAEKCAHGAERDRHKNWPKGLGFTEPLESCACCGTLFYYIESLIGPFAEPDEAGRIRQYWHCVNYEPKDLCISCGGQYINCRELDKPDDSPPPPSLQERLAAFKLRKAEALDATLPSAPRCPIPESLRIADPKE